MPVNSKADDDRFQLSDGRTLAWLTIGDPGGRPVFYFHGYPGSRLEAQFATAAVARCGLRLIAPDRPGFGGSAFKPGRTIGQWSDDVAELADHLGINRFAVIGVSGGGPYALACAARIPRRLTGVALVAGLGPLTQARLARDMAIVDRLALALAARCPPLARWAVRLAAYWVRRHPAHCLAAMAAGVEPVDRHVLAAPDHHRLLAESTAEAVRQGGKGVAWEITLMTRPWDFDLRAIALPVRIWQGLADRIVPPAMARYLAATLPACECHMIPGEGHLSIIVNYLDAVFEDLCR
jgi:pimeloyl-ACP methyl ester carboxylesterase